MIKVTAWVEKTFPDDNRYLYRLHVTNGAYQGEITQTLYSSMPVGCMERAIDACKEVILREMRSRVKEETEGLLDNLDEVKL